MITNPLASFNLAGRTALVTGARREIGRAIALGLAAQGARVAVHHAGTEEEARDAGDVVAEIRANFGGEAEAFGCDFSGDDAGRELADAVIARFAQVDVLVLNASIEILEDYDQVSRAHFDRQIAVNLRTTLELIQHLVPPMAARGWGRVLAIGSVQQDIPHPQMMVYAGTKAAQANWIRNLARQVGPSGVTANNLAPGAILTARNREQLDPETAAKLIEHIPVRRLGRPEDIVGAALLLCSDAGSYINGANILVDGGLRASRAS